MWHNARILLVNVIARQIGGTAVSWHTVMNARSGVEVNKGFYADRALIRNAGGFDAGNLIALEGGKVTWTTHDDLGAIGRTIASDEDMAAWAHTRGAPETATATIPGYYRAARAGEFTMVDATLAKLLGRAPDTMDSVMRAHLNKMRQTLCVAPLSAVHSR